MLSCIAKGAWMDMLCILADAADCGTLTNSATAWARYIGLTKDELLGVVQELEAGGVGNIKIEGEQITITSNRLKRDYKEYRAQCNQAAEAGKKSGESRRKRKLNDRFTTVQRETNDRSTTVAFSLERNANEKSTIPESRIQNPESKSLSTEREYEREDFCFAEIPSWEDVLEFAKNNAILPETAKSFFEYHDNNGYWFNKFDKLIPWKKKIRSWKVNDQSIRVNGNQPKFQPIEI